MLPLGGDQMCNQSYLFLFMRFLITVQVFHTGQAIIQYKGIQFLFLFSNEFRLMHARWGEHSFISFQMQLSRPDSAQSLGLPQTIQAEFGGQGNACHGQTRGVPNSVIRPVGNQGNRHLKISRQARGMANLLIANMGKVEARFPPNSAVGQPHISP